MDAVASVVAAKERGQECERPANRKLAAEKRRATVVNGSLKKRMAGEVRRLVLRRCMWLRMSGQRTPWSMGHNRTNGAADDGTCVKLNAVGMREDRTQAGRKLDALSDLDLVAEVT